MCHLLRKISQKYPVFFSNLFESTKKYLCKNMYIVKNDNRIPRHILNHVFLMLEKPIAHTL
jgi:hypothetical protein